MRVWITFWGRFTLFAIANVVWIRRYYPDVDYKKYLGPNWKPDYTGLCSTTVANHTAF